ncbi:hypothetical protein [Mycolicibacter kumamotonensis]|uniref:Uncharacterized protein n=1 Tax=Mycolicibacter kumamotonensis TaxID=354243 RepID=A0A1B8S9A3_9MYCO|nr:hypothetical protein [Mycolicibacter kumamotonensis]OBY29300.1 hypothetical protein ACT18_23785 [Mycolicibacter kumamotonensis]
MSAPDGPAPRRIVVRVVQDGEDLHLCDTGLSLLFGVPESEIRPGMEYPAEWQRQAARRVNEAGAHTGQLGLLAALGYWCQLERDGAELVVIEQP